MWVLTAAQKSWASRSIPPSSCPTATFCRYLNTPNGTPYGYQVYKWDNIINRLNSMDDEQMFKGLRLTGAACENIDGYNLCYLNGNIQGKKTLKDAEEEQ